MFLFVDLLVRLYIEQESFLELQMSILKFKGGTKESSHSAMMLMSLFYV